MPTGVGAWLEAGVGMNEWLEVGVGILFLITAVIGQDRPRLGQAIPQTAATVHCCAPLLFPSACSCRCPRTAPPPPSSCLCVTRRARRTRCPARSPPSWSSRRWASKWQPYSRHSPHTQQVRVCVWGGGGGVAHACVCGGGMGRTWCECVCSLVPHACMPPFSSEA